APLLVEPRREERGRVLDRVSRARDRYGRDSGRPGPRPLLRFLGGHAGRDVLHHRGLGRRAARRRGGERLSGHYGRQPPCVPLVPGAAMRYGPWLGILCIIGVIYGAFVAYAQKDMKRLVAYSSVSHLGLIVIGIGAFTSAAVTGSVLQMINHGLSTGALFLLVGVLYERTHTREIADYGGIAGVAPVPMALFLVATFS